MISAVASIPAVAGLPTDVDVPSAVSTGSDVPVVDGVPDVPFVFCAAVDPADGDVLNYCWNLWSFCCCYSPCC